MRGDRVYQLGLTSTLVLFGWLVGESALAQIDPDETLGDERSTVTRDVEIRDRLSDRIDGGARRGANLFHSFEQFDVNEGRAAYFSNPADVQNIFSRVTGIDRSEIMGTLGVLGNANLFFLNPNGILFGPNASLDLGGSFVGTTADGIQFGEQGFFSATNPETPSGLLTIEPSAFFFNQLAAQPITQFGPPNQPDSASYIEGLRVPDGRSLLLLGGQINIQDGRLRASSGRLELGGVAGTGTVGLGMDSNQLSLSFPEGLDRADIFITGLSDIDVTGGGGGDIAMYARNLNILNGSDVCAGIGPASSCGRQTSNLGTVESQAGDIFLNAQEKITIADSISEVTNSVNNNSIGNGGTVFVQAGSLLLTNAGRIRASVFGQGNSGGVTTNVRNRILLDGSTDGDLRSGIFSTIGSQGIGNAGNIQVTTGSLSITDGAIINAGTFGQQGNAGNVVIHARNNILISGMNRSRTPPPSGVFTTMEGRRGQSGEIRIFARALSFTGGAQLVTRTFGEGDAGNVFVRVTDSISFRGRVPGIAGEGRRDVFSSGILTDNISGQGNAGETNIAADSISLSGGAQLTNNTFGEGNANRIIINANRVSIDGTGPEVPDGRAPSTVASEVGRERVVGDDGEGNGGRIEVTAGFLSLTNGGQLSTSTFAQGNAGDIIIRADRVSIDGTSINGQFPSGIFSGVNQESRGNGGDIEVITESLSLTNGGQISASTFAQGNAGDVIIRVRDQVSFDGTSADGQLWSGVFSSVGQGARGRGGIITINADNLNLTDGAIISAQSQETGEAGNIRVQVNERFSSTNSTVITAAERSGGNIQVEANEIRLFGDSTIRTSSGATGGNITLEANSILAFDNSDIFAFAEERGGDITLNTPAFFGNDYSPDTSDGNPEDLDGNDRVDVNAEGDVESGTITTPDTSFIQNSLTDLPETAIDTQTLLANSCMVRSQEQSGRFVIVGPGGLPQRPGDLPLPTYGTGEVRSVSAHIDDEPQWHRGDPIVEPQNAYQLEDGRVILSRECT